MSDNIAVKDFTLGSAKNVRSFELTGPVHVPGHAIVSPSDGTPLFSEGSFDAFLRQRVTLPTTLFHSTHQYNLDARLWDTSLSVNGTATHLPNESSINLSTVAGTNNNSAILQSKAYHRYIPGKGQLIMQTFVMGSAQANVVRRVGYFDANNGCFLEQNGQTDIAFVVRSYTSGSPVDTRVVSGAWNIDKFDGTGPSKLTLDLSKAQILAIDAQWLGVGTVEFGFFINRKYYPAHRQNTANLGTSVYMTTCNLPVRYEIVNVGAAGGANTLKVICSTVISEGGVNDAGYARYSAGNGATPISVTTLRPIFSIRPNTLFNGITFRGLIRALGWRCYSDASAYFRLIQGGTLTGASFANFDATNSAVQMDVAATAISGGVVIDDVYVTATGAQARGAEYRELQGDIPLTLNAAGNTADILSVCAARFAGTTNCSGSIRWAEEK